MAAKKQSPKCTVTVRNLPLDRFRLPGDGRKWKQAARSRSGLLVRISSYANGDGTFVRDGKNYSPSWETLTKHVSSKSLARWTDDLAKLGFLSWTRDQHYSRRVYTIHLPETLVTFDEEHLSDSEKHLSDSPSDSENTCQIGNKHLSDSPKSLVTMGGIPSLPSKEPSKEREPSAPAAAIENQKPSLSPDPSGSKPSTKKISVDEAVNYLIKTALVRNSAAAFDGGSNKKLGDALKQITPGPKYAELDSVIEKALASCDDFMLRNFGSRLAAQLVGSVQALRARKEEQNEKREAARPIDEWQNILDEVAEDFSEDVNLDLDQWLKENPYPGDNPHFGEYRVSQAKKTRTEMIADRDRFREAWQKHLREDEDCGWAWWGDQLKTYKTRPSGAQSYNLFNEVDIVEADVKKEKGRRRIGD